MITEGNCKGNTAADFVFWTGAGNAPSSSVRIHSAQQHHFGRWQPCRQLIPPHRRLHRHRQKENTKTQLWLVFLFFFSSPPSSGQPMAAAACPPRTGAATGSAPCSPFPACYRKTVPIVPYSRKFLCQQQNNNNKRKGLHACSRF